MTTAVVLSHEWAETVRLLLAVGIPIIVGLISKSSASSGLKSTLNVVLSALVTAVTTILDHANADVAHVIRDFIYTAGFSFATYYGVWKPTGIAGTIAAKTEKFGFGSPPDLTTSEKGLEDLQVEPKVMAAVADAVEAADEEPPPPKKAPAKKVAKKAPATKKG
jgi:hypothetical protein